MTSPRSLPPVEITRLLDAPRELVFRHWIEPEHLQTWFAVDTYTATACAADPRPGGAWYVDFISDTGHVYSERGVFREVAFPERLVLTLTQVDGGRVGPETEITVLFADVGGKTSMALTQTGFDSAPRRDGNAAGWLGCFDKLAAHLAA